MVKVCVIQVNVSDMDKAVEFYCDKLGFEVKDRRYYPHIVQLAHEGVPFILNKVDRPTRIDYPDQAQTLLNLQTDDLRATIRDLMAKGVDLIHDEPQDCPVGVYAAFRDPFGNVHEILEFRE